jgi:hypothetical protein
MSRITPERVWAEYQRLLNYNTSNGLYKDAQRCEDFYVGKQWEGVNAPDLDKPVIDVIKRSIQLFIATVVSDDVSASLQPSISSRGLDLLARIATDEINNVIENTKFKQLSRQFVRDAAVDGDACAYVYFDPSVDTGNITPGEICVERIDNTNVLFGNPQSWDVRNQPFIIIRMRKMVQAARDEAIASGMSDEEAKELIRADDERQGGLSSENDNDEGHRVTMLIRFWKERGEDGQITVWAGKYTQNAEIKAPEPLGYREYPLAWMSWERIKNSAYGQSAVKEMIPNQVFTNKLFAMASVFVQKMAWPTRIVNERFFKKKFTNRIGELIGVNGAPPQDVVYDVPGQQLPPSVIQMIDKTVASIRDSMGISDVVLGNVKPDNTSAIIALQKTSTAPLELQKMDFYQFVEDFVRIVVDIMRVNYGLRLINPVETENGETISVFNFSELGQLRYKLTVNVGPSTYWSEIAQVQTIDNLLNRQMIDPLTFFEIMPSSYLPQKGLLIQKAKEMMARQEATAQQAQQVPASGDGQLISGGLQDGEVPTVQYGIEDSPLF